MKKYAIYLASGNILHQINEEIVLLIYKRLEERQNGYFSNRQLETFTNDKAKTKEMIEITAIEAITIEKEGLI